MAQPTSPPGRQNAPSLPPAATANASPNAVGGPLPLPTISMVDIYSREGDEMVVQLKLDRASSQPVTVNYAVAFESPAPSTHTSASADDFENLNTRPLTGTVTFAPGAVEQFRVRRHRGRHDVGRERSDHISERVPRNRGNHISERVPKNRRHCYTEETPVSE